jgi:hypothetical protein
VSSPAIRVFAFLVLQFFSTALEAQSFEQATKRESRIYLEVSPQFNYISQPGVQSTQAYGGEYSAFYQAFPGWLAGGSLRQVFSIRTGGTSVLSGIAVHVKHYLFGGSTPRIQEYSYAGQVMATKTSWVTSGMSVIGSLEQMYVNGEESTIPFSGFGIMTQYEYPLGPQASIAAGLGAERLSSARKTILPFRAKLGIGIYLP